ncbi:MAG: phosphoribosylformylglycinamidine synthase subunit PurL [bacterium]|jgi:phosphoribosylformylglycinamidine synthase|nr:phosphoribosylformylglycinamidine synthase subunit PurL [bacterium]
MTGVRVSDRTLREVALTREEYRVIVESLGREPNSVELGMLGVLWSEHCSYKSSKPLLRRLPTTGPHVVQGPGENAGAVDIGQGWAAVFKVESHNHPSAIEPYQGAATGVGGIIRDVMAMGARPVALLDSLRCGPLPESRHHLEGVVGGIGGYGNCIGIPTVGGEVYFDETYAGNPLVNAMCVGVARIEDLHHARAEGAGNSILLVGAATGRDGIHGASFASVELDEDSQERRPAVQVGDPFLEKCLLEACLQLKDVTGVVGIQDLGAAGLTSAVAECAGRGGAGATIDVSAVPRREVGMTPYEVMLSESQERMLVVVERGLEPAVETCFERWGLQAVRIGEVTDDGCLTVRDGSSVAAELPVELLTSGAPVRRLASRQPAEQATILNLDHLLAEPPDLGGTLKRLLGSPNLCSRLPIFRRYDHMVGNGTVLPPGGDAAVIRLLGTRIGIAVTIDGNGRYCELDPYVGAEIAVCEAARNLLATGARPLAITDCLNFANPERPEIYWQLEAAVGGIATACRALDLPVVSGNVSLYNEARLPSSDGQVDDEIHPILPTPVIGMVGVLDDYERRLPAGLQEDGDFVILLGETRNELGGSEYMKVMHGQSAGRPPQLDLARERAAHEFMLEASAAGLLHSAHDVAEGGLLVAIAETCLLGDRGLRAAAFQPPADVQPAAFFFGETQGRFVLGAPSRAMPELQSLARRLKLELHLLGLAGGDRLELERQLSVSLDEMREAWEQGLAPSAPTGPAPSASSS